MRKLLRTLGVLLLVGGAVVCIASARAAVGDEAYYRAALALERHPDHILFQAEYHAALARHVAYVLTAVVSGLGAVIASVTLFALAAVLGRLDRLETGLVGR